MIFQIF